MPYEYLNTMDKHFGSTHNMWIAYLSSPTKCTQCLQNAHVPSSAIGALHAIHADLEIVIP
jgi:hypothetical protein